MSDRLVIEETGGVWRIVWELEDEGDIGAALGESQYTERDLAGATGGDWEHIKATLAVAATDGVERDSNGYFWETYRGATAALRAAKAALRDKSGKPLPEWAVKALAAGWKAPKGWAP